MSLELKNKALLPFIIKVDEYSIDVYLQKVREGGAKKGQTVEIPKGSFNDLNYALKYIVKERTRLELETKSLETTIERYIEKYSEVEEEIAGYTAEHLSIVSLKKLIEEQSSDKKPKKEKDEN